MKGRYSYFLLVGLIFGKSIFAQQDDNKKWWHDKERTLRYHPEGSDLTITNGKQPYNIVWADGPTSEDRQNLCLRLPGATARHDVSF